MSESDSEHERGEGRDGSIRVFDPVESDDETDSVIDALQRGLEGDVIPVETLTHEVVGSRCTLVAPRVVGSEPDPIAFRRPRRSVLAHGSQIEMVETVADEDGSVISTSGEGVFATVTEPDIVMPEVRGSSAGIREGFRRLDSENLTTMLETGAEDCATVLKGR